MRKRFHNVSTLRGTLICSVAVAALVLGCPASMFAEPAPAPAAAAALTTVTGEVLDSTGEPLIGASVSVKGQPGGAVTDIDGNFSIKMPAGATLVVSYVGFKPKEVKPEGSHVVVTLTEDNNVLGEVVVVGYGTQKKATMTGSVAVIDEKAMENKGSLSSPVQALQGQVPGVIITRNSSAPGDESWSMSLRGAVSKNAAEPLVIIDGVEYESVNELRLLNPSDIESMNFLKDAAASIYGSKAAGGVVLVTTKKAKEGKVKVEYSGSYTYKHIGLQAEAMSLDEWADAILQARTNDGYNLQNDVWMKYATMAKLYKNQWIAGNPLGMAKVSEMVFFDTDWQDVMWGDSWSTQHELSVSGGTDKNTYRFSLGYMYDDSNLKWGNNHNQRINLRLNNNMQLARNFSLQSVISYNRQDQVAPSQIGAALNVGQAQPGFPTSTIDGKPFSWGQDWKTPNWLCELGGDNKLKVNAVNISETLKYTILEGFNANAVLGYNHSEAIRDTKYKSIDFYLYNGQTIDQTYPLKTGKDSNSYEKSASSTDFYSVQAYLDYNKTFNQVHDMTVMAGVQYNMKQYEYTRVRTQEIQPTLEVPNGTGTITVPSAQRWEEAILSYYGRANYAYNSKYMIEGQFRYDGSSKFQAANRWAFFWGASLGWRITEEAFMQNIKQWVNELKLRASYGNVGNQSGIDRYAGVMLYNLSSTGGNIIGGELVGTMDTNGKLVSTDRTWERVHNYNIALDFGFFNNRLSGTFEYFWKRTNNMLIDVLYPGILGDKAPTANKGKFKAYGWEGQVTWRDRIGQVNYYVGGTFTNVENRLVDNGGSGAIGAGTRSDQEGYPLNSVWGYRYAGKIQNEEQLEKYKARYREGFGLAGNIELLRVGDNMFQDVNGDGKLDQDDLVYLGTDDPKIQYSFNAGVEWNGFDLGVVFQGAANRTIWRVTGTGNDPDPWRVPMRNTYQNTSNHFVGNIWSPETPDNRYPTLTNQAGINDYNYQCSSWSVQDGSYLRLKNLTIGYTLPRHIIERQKVLSNVRVYVTGTDIWEWKKNTDDWDPEAARRITNSARYPFLRTWTVGATVSF
ncbi:MAG: TonB-dependent receptor [Muribaculaceae bacterium]|nr:TonB-dependent receptor [Muribaculaceae bacterium]